MQLIILRISHLIINYRLIAAGIGIGIFLVLPGCKPAKKEYQLVLKEHITLDSIPSASGIAIRMDSAYIIGDDATNIYKIALKNYGYRKIHLAGSSLEYRVSKSVKQDFESAVIARNSDVNWLMAFGSGTLAPHRDSMLLMNLGNEMAKTFSLAKLYYFLFRIHHLGRDSMNMEAATVIKDNLYLFNRGSNSFFKMPVNNLFAYLDAKENPQMPASAHYRIELPTFNGIPALISGAATLDDHRILFTASLENTKDWTKDGEIFGSYVGILDVSGKQPKLETCLLLSENNKPLTIKLESLDVISNSGKQIDIISVSDNDDGSSGIYLLQLKIK
jgi:hypothetical protein